MNDAEFKNLVRSWNDFPTKGISFKDINPLLRTPDSMYYLNEKLSEICANIQINKIAVIESRGFVVGSLLATSLSKGLVLIRKEGKLPGPTIKESYSIEYGTRVMEIQEDAILKGERSSDSRRLACNRRYCGCGSFACRKIRRHSSWICVYHLFELFGWFGYIEE